MHKGLLAILLLTALAFSGCSGKKGDADFEDVTCPDGTILTSEQIEANEHHHDAGFNATSMCPVAPKVVLTGLPTSVMVYRAAPFTWTVDPGSVAHGHSMSTDRYANASVPDNLASITTYGKQIVKKEHQDLPVTFKGNVTFTTVGKVYVRAYAAVQGEHFDRRDVWSAEVVINILPVNATGVVQTVTHSLGGPGGKLDPESYSAKLGDAIKFANDDLAPSYKLRLDSAPAGAPACELTATSMGESAGTCMFIVPGAYTFKTDDVQPKSVDVNVAQ